MIVLLCCECTFKCLRSEHKLSLKTILFPTTQQKQNIYNFWHTNEHSCFTNLIIKWLVGGFDNLCLSCLIFYGHTNHRTDISSSQLTSLYNPHSNLTNPILNASINLLLTCISIVSTIPYLCWTFGQLGSIEKSLIKKLL